MRSSHVLNAVLAVAVLAVALFSGPSDGRAFELVHAAGAVTLSNSHEGVAVLGAQNLRPGTPATGAVTIGNPGSTTTALALELATEAETPGRGGGKLSDRMRIVIASEGYVVYDGPLGAVGRLALRALGAGAQRTYTMTAWLPSGPDDNAFQAARLSLRFTWLADAEAQPVSREPDPPPVTPPPPATGPDPNATVTAEQLFSLPSAKACLSKRALKVRVRAKRGVSVKSVRVYVNNRRKGSSKGSKATINLRGLPRGTFRVKVRATLSNGRTLTLKRTYRTCVKSSRQRGKARSTALR